MKSVSEYLKMPYGRVVVPESDGTFRAEITEFPGCIATGETAANALANLEDVASSWLESMIARGQKIPLPTESTGFSGKLVLRLPKSLHRKAAHVAAREGVSLNSFIANSLAEQVGLQSSSRNVVTVFISRERQMNSSYGQWMQLMTPDAPSQGAFQRANWEFEHA